MNAHDLPLPEALPIPDVCRHLPPGRLAGFVQAVPRDGDLALAELAAGAGSAALHLSSGRIATLYPGDRFLCVTGSYRSALALSCTLPPRLGPAMLVQREGIVGLPAALAGRAAREPTPLRLLGLAVDRDGARLNLAALTPALPRQARPLNTLAVVSATRGAQAAALATAALRGFCRMGLRSACAKPVGALDAAERWAQLDAGAIQSLDAVDAGALDSAGRDADTLLARSQGLLGRLAADGAQAAVLRIAGGLAVPEVSALLGTRGFADLVDGVVLAAADAMAAVEAAQRLAALGLPPIAIGGAITRSPLACREARAALDLPLLSAAELAQPAVLQRLLSAALRRAPVHALRRAA